MKKVAGMAWIKARCHTRSSFKGLEGRIRIKEITPNKTKLGIFITTFTLSSDFLNLMGKSVAELVLRRKISDMTRNLDNFCKTNSLSSLL